MGEPQRLTEIAYLDEIRNLGYEPLRKRDGNRAKVKKDSSEIRFAFHLLFEGFLGFVNPLGNSLL